MTAHTDDRADALFKLVVVSDTHGDTARLERLLPIINSANYMIFCGDGAADIMRVGGRITVPMVCVRGNNDFFSVLTDTATADFGKCSALVTHGHRYDVRREISLLAEAALSENCNLAFYGHTHKYFDGIRSGVHIINPGALCNGSYAIVTSADGVNFASRNCFI